MAAWYRINDTAAYHRDQMNTLGWEVTVCNALESVKSPARRILQKNDTFGNLLCDLLLSNLDLDAKSHILEIGGGYGYVMRDFLAKISAERVVMLDLSPVLLDRQRETLKNVQAEFILKNFFDTERAFLEQFDLVLLNEIAGDFPTLCDIDPRCLALPDEELDPYLIKVKNFYSLTGIPAPSDAFNFNLGAIEAVERLCSARVTYIYVSEHSSEAEVPDPLDPLRDKICLESPGNPERIPLAGHDEYSVRFSHLEALAEKYGYRVKRGQYKDFIDIKFTSGLNFILTSNSAKGEHEAIRHFVEDLYRYEYVLLMKT
jgi:hypothetical protein